MCKISPKPLTVFMVLAMVAVTAQSAGPALTPDTVVGMIQNSMVPGIDKLASKAITWLAIFTTIQFMITNYGLLRSDGGIDSVIAKLVGSFVWMGVCIYIINNGPKFIGGAGDEFFRIVGLDLPSPSEILKGTFAIASGLAVAAAGVGKLSNEWGQYIVYASLLFLGVGIFFAFKIFMIQLELALIVMLSPLSFSFLGLNALRDQGIAPFKALISLGYRIVLTTIILSAFTQVHSVTWAAIKAISLDEFLDGGFGKVFEVMLSAVGAYIFLAYLLFKSDAVAASLAGGHTSMGTADVASAAAAGAAMGAAVATTGAAVAGASKSIPAMSDVMSQIKGSISNASSIGSGGGTGLEMPPPLPPSGGNSSQAYDGKPPPIPDGYSPAIPDPFTKAGSGVNAGVGVAPGSSTQPQSGDKPGSRTVGGSMSELGRHLSSEKAPTHVSINTHHSH